MDIEDKKFRTELEPHKQPNGHVNAVTFSPDGKWLASADTTGQVDIYRSPGLQHETSFFADSSHVRANCRAIAFSRECLAAGTDCGSITLYHIGSWRELARQEDGPVVYSMCFSADGQWLAAGTDNPHLILYRVQNWEREYRCKLALGNGIYCVLWHPTNSEMLVAGDDSGIVTIVDANTLLRRHTLPRGTNGPLMNMKFSPDGRMLFTCHQGGVHTLWDTDTWQRKARKEQETKDEDLVTCMSIMTFLPHRDMVIVGDESCFNLWKLENIPPSMVSPGGSTMDFREIGRLEWGGRCIDASFDGMCVAIGSSTSKATGHLRLLSESWYQAMHAASINTMIELAHSGCKECMYCLGVVFAQGKLGAQIIQRNDAEAAIWFRRAASEGFIGGGRHQDQLTDFYKRSEDKPIQGGSSDRAALVWQSAADLQLLDNRYLNHLYKDWQSIYDTTVQQLSQRSISFRELLELRSHHQLGRSKGMTTRKVVETIIKPATEQRAISYVEMLEEKKNRLNSNMLTNKMADFYVIHAWDMQFEDMLLACSSAARGEEQGSLTHETLEMDTYKEEQLNTRLWICAFCINQHQGDRLNLGHPGHQTNKLEHMIKAFGASGKKAIFCLDHFNTCVDRMWCMNEVFECESAGLEVSFYGSCHAAPNRKDFKSLPNCSVTSALDREHILRRVIAKHTIARFDERVFRIISEGIFEQIDRVEKTTSLQQLQAHQFMEEQLRREMKRASVMFTTIQDKELHLEETVKEETEGLHQDVEDLREALENAEQKISDMEDRMEAQDAYLQERETESMQKENYLKSEMRELFNEMKTMQQDLVAENESLREDLKLAMLESQAEIRELRTETMERLITAPTVASVESYPSLDRTKTLDQKRGSLLANHPGTSSVSLASIGTAKTDEDVAALSSMLPMDLATGENDHPGHQPPIHQSTKSLVSKRLHAAMHLPNVAALSTSAKGLISAALASPPAGSKPGRAMTSTSFGGSHKSAGFKEAAQMALGSHHDSRSLTATPDEAKASWSAP